MEFRVFVSFIVVIVLFSGCVDKAEEKALPEDFSPESKLLFIELAAAASLPYYESHRTGLRQASDELRIRTEFIGPDTYDIEALEKEFAKAIARKPDGLIVNGISSRLVPYINEAMASGIPVVTIDSDLPESDRLAYIGTDNYSAGRLGGQFLAEEMKGEGLVFFLTYPGQPNLEARKDGYISVFADYPDIIIGEERNTNFDPYETSQIAGDIIINHPDVRALICLDNISAYYVAMAVRGAGKVGEILIMGMDDAEGTIDEIEAGVITATLIQSPELMSYYSAKLLYDYHKKGYEIGGNTYSLNIPAEIDTGIVLGDYENITRLKGMK